MCYRIASDLRSSLNPREAQLTFVVTCRSQTRGRRVTRLRRNCRVHHRRRPRGGCFAPSDRLAAHHRDITMESSSSWPSQADALLRRTAGGRAGLGRRRARRRARQGAKVIPRFDRGAICDVSRNRAMQGRPPSLVSIVARVRDAMCDVSRTHAMNAARVPRAPQQSFGILV